MIYFRRNYLDFLHRMSVTRPYGIIEGFFSPFLLDEIKLVAFTDSFLTFQVYLFLPLADADASA